MASIVPGFEYDIFISYRHKDNKGDHWVTEFVNALKSELESTFKEDISIYFDTNPHDGLLETHDVGKSLEGKLRCLIFIPIISQTYCDPRSFAWQHEFCAFNKMAREDQIGRDVKLGHGNVSSRILPVRVHDLDAADQATLEDEIGGALRAVEFIYKEMGVNRPLKPTDSRSENQNKTDYRNQVNKVANAIKEIISSIKNPAVQLSAAGLWSGIQTPVISKRRKSLLAFGSVALLLLGLVGYFLYSRLIPVESVDQRNSIAVLYFDNISSDPEQDYFSDGITEEITAHLSSIQGLRVTSRTSVIPFKGKSKAINIREIANQLNVNNVLEGSVRKSGDKLRITAQLIDARTDKHIWTEVFDRNLTDVFKIQSEIAHAIADKFKVVISKAANERIISIPTTNIQAYELYLKARSVPRRMGDGIGENLANWEHARAWLKEAIALDPDFSQPYALLSRLSRGYKDSSSYYAKEAIIRNPNAVEGYLALARTSDFGDAVKWLHKAYAIDSIAGLEGMGELYGSRGIYIAAIRCFSQVIKLNPYLVDPYVGKAYTYNEMAQPDSTKKYLRMVERMAPNNEHIYRIGLVYSQYTADIEGAKVNALKYFKDDTLSYNKEIGIACLYAKDWKKAKYYYDRTNYRDMDWGLILIKLGQRDLGMSILRQSLAFRGTTGWWGDYSRINAVLGDKQKGIYYFRKLMEYEGIDIKWMHIDPFLDELRGEPEFKKIVAEIGQRNADDLRTIRGDAGKPFSLDLVADRK